MRSKLILVSTAAVAAAVIGTGCMTPLLEPLEPQLVFRPTALDETQVKALAGTGRVEEVRLATKDGLQLHGALLARQLVQARDVRPGLGREIVERPGPRLAGGETGTPITARSPFLASEKG